jgi:hypothetical protein
MEFCPTGTVPRDAFRYRGAPSGFFAEEAEEAAESDGRVAGNGAGVDWDGEAVGVAGAGGVGVAAGPWVGVAAGLDPAAGPRFALRYFTAVACSSRDKAAPLSIIRETTVSHSLGE